MIDTCDERVDKFTDALRKARKPHRCGECFRDIRKGELYEHMVGKLSGDICVENTCLHCVEARKWLLRECSGFCYGGIEEDLREHWVEDGIRTKELAKLLFGMRRKWTKRNGQLMDLPTVEKQEKALI